MPTKKRPLEISSKDAISWILNDYEFERQESLPSLDLLVIVDILHILDLAGSASVLEMLSRLRILRSKQALILYLDSLLGLGMVSREEVKYRGAIPVKLIYGITESGKILLKVLDSVGASKVSTID